MVAEVTDVDPLDPRSRTRLRELLVAHGVVLIRGLELDAPDVARAAGTLGTPLRHPPHPAYPDLPEIAPIANDEALGRVGSPYWHTDGLLRPDPPCVTLFYASEVPEEGGDTLFLDARAAYAELDADDRELLRSLTAVFETGTRAPLVREHPVTGVPALAANLAATVGIEGVERSSAARLLGDLREHYEKPGRVHRHHFERGDLLIWDNWAVSHSATPVPPPPAVRLMLRADVHAWVDYPPAG